MTFIQLIDDNIRQPTVNYAYAHPHITTAVTAAVIGGGVAAFVGLGGIPVVVTFIKPCYIITAFSFAIRPYLEPYVATVYNDHPYITSAASLTFTGVTLYFGAGNILTSKLGWGVLTVTTGTILSSIYILDTEEASKINKQCFDQTLSIEIPVDLVFETSVDGIIYPVLGFYSSCVIRATAREYFLSNETETNSSLKEIIFVGFGSGAIGGIFRYGAKALAHNETPKTIIIKSIVGAINNGIYGFSAALAKEGVISYEDDALSPFVAEPGDVITEATLKCNFDFAVTDLVDAFVIAVTLYNCGEVVLPIVEDTTSGISKMFLATEIEVDDLFSW